MKRTLYKGNSPHRVERPVGYQPRAESREHAPERGSLQFKPHTADGETGYMTRPDGTIADVQDFARYLEGVLSDPVREAQLLTQARRPPHVSHVRHEIAMRSAMREPMLNADPSATRKALEGRSRLRRNARLDKLAPFKRIVVKPCSSITGTHGWQERMWSIHKLKYGPGVVAVTDDGDETMICPQWSDLRSRIVKSGWDIIREEVPKSGNTRSHQGNMRTRR